MNDHNSAADLRQRLLAYRPPDYKPFRDYESTPEELERFSKRMERSHQKLARILGFDPFRKQQDRMSVVERIGKLVRPSKSAPNYWAEVLADGFDERHRQAEARLAEFQAELAERPSIIELLQTIADGVAGKPAPKKGQPGGRPRVELEDGENRICEAWKVYRADCRKDRKKFVMADLARWPSDYCQKYWPHEDEPPTKSQIANAWARHKSVNRRKSAGA